MDIFTAFTVWILSVFPVTGRGIKEDKVCFLDDRTPACNSHQLGCVRDEITILSAMYSSMKDCDKCVTNRCTTCRSNGRNVPLQPSANCSRDYHANDYWKVITACSKRNSCSFPVPSLRFYNECTSMTAFSHIRYRCVDATYEINMCGGEEQVGEYLTLFFNGTRSTNASQRCVCRVTGSDPTEAHNITALDIRMRDVGDQNVPQLVLSSPHKEPTYIKDKTNIRSYSLSLREPYYTEIILDFKPNSAPERIWILIEGEGEVRAKCEEVMLPTTKNSHKLPGPSQSPVSRTIYTVIGGAAAGSILLVVIILLSVYFYSRRKVLAPTESPTKYKDKDVES